MFFLKDKDIEHVNITESKIPDELKGKSYNELAHYMMTSTPISPTEQPNK